MIIVSAFCIPLRSIAFKPGRPEARTDRERRLR